MPLDLSIVGWKSESHLVTWDSTRAIRYALGVGAGTVPGLDELAFVTENTAGVAQRVLPTFPVVLGQGLFRVPYGDVDLSKLVHAEQSVELLGEITPSGRGQYQARVTEIYDKGSGALIRTEGLLTGKDGTPLTPAERRRVHPRCGRLRRRPGAVQRLDRAAALARHRHRAADRALAGAAVLTQGRAVITGASR